MYEFLPINITFNVQKCIEATTLLMENGKINKGKKDN